MVDKVKSVDFYLAGRVGEREECGVRISEKQQSIVKLKLWRNAFAWKCGHRYRSITDHSPTIQVVVYVQSSRGYVLKTDICALPQYKHNKATWTPIHMPTAWAYVFDVAYSKYVRVHSMENGDIGGCEAHAMGNTNLPCVVNDGSGIVFVSHNLCSCRFVCSMFVFCSGCGKWHSTSWLRYVAEYNSCVCVCFSRKHAMNYCALACINFVLSEKLEQQQWKLT